MLIGSPAIGAVLALWGFWAILAIGLLRGDLSVRGAAIFVMLWLVGFVGLRHVLSGMLLVSYVAVLDIALVLVVFRGDVRIT
jgi:hypothetical protein